MPQYREVEFEKAIEYFLIERGGYESRPPTDFDMRNALFVRDLVAYVQATTDRSSLDFLRGLHDDELGKAIENAACRALQARGSLDVLRHGFTLSGRTLLAAQFAPETDLNEVTARNYEANRLTITRQVHFDPLRTSESVDLVIALNGIPVVTAELKNPMTGQTAEDAKTQYMEDRDPRAPLLAYKQRAVVHFAADPDEVWMTTKLAGRDTDFLPFNKGRDHGAGNPDNPQGYRTAYLWEEVLTRESILEILGRFVHIQTVQQRFETRTVVREKTIFPRYHQLDAVRLLARTAKVEGAGFSYLIEHSAGSGKSNSIAWLAHRLAGLHRDSVTKVFDSVVVITDRKVLDRQLQDAIFQFEHKQGVVEKIDRDSNQLATALINGVPIIITTLQKFPFVVEKVEGLPERKYAVIVDEAHSSQSGESIADLKLVLGQSGVDPGEFTDEEIASMGSADVVAEIRRSAGRRTRQQNLSFFAFTATPKYKTLELFGRPGSDGKPEPFHLYTMRQAIEEKFILDVLAHYTTYRAYYGLVKAVEDDPKLDKRGAARALARFMSLHPHNLSQKAEVIVEHFRAHTMRKIGGRAKAMIVTSGREHAVRFKLAIDEYISEKAYEEVRALVAFSDAVDVEGIRYTEATMNPGVRPTEIPEALESDGYQVLIVADKYQTGFDQPLLHTMYVDRRLADVQAVQTLSRLNRKHAGKEDTFVLDFVNTEEDIRLAFEPYYTVTAVGQQVDPDRIYELKADLDGTQVYWLEEVEQFARVFFKPPRLQRPDDHARMNSILDRAVGRWRTVSQEDAPAAEEFRSRMVAFRNLYSFFSQIVPYSDVELEKAYVYMRFLLLKLPRRGSHAYSLDDDVALKFYRLERQLDDIAIGLAGAAPVQGPSMTGTGVAQEEEVPLSRIIDKVNERFGTDFSPADQLFFDQIAESALADLDLRQAALVNTLDNFHYAFERAVEGLLIDRMEDNATISTRFMDDPDFRHMVTDLLARQVYEVARSESA